MYLGSRSWKLDWRRAACWCWSCCWHVEAIVVDALLSIAGMSWNWLLIRVGVESWYVETDCWSELELRVGTLKLIVETDCWSVLIRVDPCWSVLNHFATVRWSDLAEPKLEWSVLRLDNQKTNHVPFSVACTTISSKPTYIRNMHHNHQQTQL